MKIVDIKVLQGPNYWSTRKCHLIQMLLDLGELEYKPTDAIPGFYERIKNLLPSLFDHHCSEGVPGGFFYRVKTGTWMGHVIEHIALEIQTLAGMEVGFGRTRQADKEGLYNVVFSYTEPNAGVYAAYASVAIAEALINDIAYDLEADIKKLREITAKEALGPSTKAIVEEAAARDIPCVRLDDNSLVQLGYGAKQKRIEATIASTTSSLAVDIAGNKETTKRILERAEVPVPGGEIIETEEDLKDLIKRLEYPLVLKPVDGNQGKGATTDITSWNEALEGFKLAKSFSKKVVCERFIKGYDFRALVINYKFVAAAKRTPASVTGDGIHTIQELIDEVNRNPERGIDHEKALTAIKVDDLTLNILAKNSCTLSTILPRGRELWLKPTANLSTGGTATDVTDIVHPKNIALFERVARVVGLDICGIDLIAECLSTPVRENGGAVIEVNAAPGLRMHLAPTYGMPRNVAKPVIDMLFPNGKDARIPIIAITGTNGKTTTSRLTAHIVKQAKYKTGYTTTDGIYIEDELIVKGDCTGPRSAKLVLQDPVVEFAVLECARGGILRGGLGFDKCDVAVVTNVAEDHLGLQGIDTLEKLAGVKSVVPESVCSGGYAVLNADDDLVYKMREKLRCNIALFAMSEENKRIKEHIKKGGLAAVYENGFVSILHNKYKIRVEEVKNIPITFDGKAAFNIANALAAVLAAYASNICVEEIRKALRSFRPCVETTPGRMNFIEFKNYKVIIDYAHNPHGLRALGNFIKAFDAGVKTGIITGVGDRRDEDIVAMGEEAAEIFDEIIIRHDEDLRGRTTEEISRLLRKGIKNISPDKKVTEVSNEEEAIEFACKKADPNSLIVILVENIQKVYDKLMRCKQSDSEHAEFKPAHEVVSV